LAPLIEDLGNGLSVEIPSEDETIGKHFYSNILILFYHLKMPG